MKAVELIAEIRKAAAALIKTDIEGFGRHLFLAIELGKLLIEAKIAHIGDHGKGGL